MLLVVPRLNQSRTKGQPDQIEETVRKDPPKKDPRTLVVETWAGSNTGRKRRKKGCRFLPGPISPISQYQHQASQRTETDGPTGQVASKDESTWLIPDTGTLVRLPSRSWPQNRRLHRPKDRGQRTLQKGHLREFLSEKAKAHLNKETAGKSKGAAPASPPRQDRVIHVIYGGSEVSGVSHAAAKKCTRNSKHGLQTIQAPTSRHRRDKLHS